MNVHSASRLSTIVSHITRAREQESTTTPGISEAITVESTESAREESSSTSARRSEEFEGTSTQEQLVNALLLSKK